MKINETQRERTENAGKIKEWKEGTMPSLGARNWGKSRSKQKSGLRVYGGRVGVDSGAENCLGEGRCWERRKSENGRLSR